MAKWSCSLHKQKSLWLSSFISGISKAFIGDRNPLNYYCVLVNWGAKIKFKCQTPPVGLHALLHNFIWQSHTYPCMISRTITPCSGSCGCNETCFLMNFHLIPVAAVRHPSPLLSLGLLTSDTASSSSHVFCSTHAICFSLHRELTWLLSSW